MVYAYTPIPKEGKKSIQLFNQAIDILKHSNIEPLDSELVSFSKFTIRSGW